jgi:hypothetical protein
MNTINNTQQSLLNVWNEAQPFLSKNAKSDLDVLNEADATDCVKTFFIDQTMAARDILTEETWKAAAGIVAYLFTKHPAIIPIVKDWYNGVAKNGAEAFQNETGCWPGVDAFYFGK